MRKSMTAALLLIFLLFFLPWLRAEDRVASPAPEGDSTSALPAPSAPPSAPRDSAILLRVLLGDTVEQMDMETYLQGVLRAEMPASFEEEALKAQAVAARTYTLHKMENGGSPNHPDADTCDDITCCKAWRSEPEAAADWGMASAAWEEKIRRAVADTDGEVILYDSSPVLAVFHSSSPGATQNAEDVWSSSLPYLRSVESPENAETVPDYYSKAAFPLAEFKSRFLAAWPEADLSDSPSNWFTNIRQTGTGTVISLQVGGVALTGGQLRDLLDLRSAAFTFSFTESEVVFSVTGYGHGVGMSQYGANVLAQQGKTYREILTHYYTDTDIGLYEKGEG